MCPGSAHRTACPHPQTGGRTGGARPRGIVPVTCAIGVGERAQIGQNGSLSLRCVPVSALSSHLTMPRIALTRTSTPWWGTVSEPLDAALTQSTCPYTTPIAQPAGWALDPPGGLSLPAMASRGVSAPVGQSVGLPGKLMTTRGGRERLPQTRPRPLEKGASSRFNSAAFVLCACGWVGHRGAMAAGDL